MTDQDPKARLLLKLSAELDQPTPAGDAEIRAALRDLATADPAALPTMAAGLERRRTRPTIQ